MLTLRHFKPSDSVTLLLHLQDPSITAALPGYRPEDVDLWVASILSDPCSYALELNGHMVGACRLEKNEYSDFSYWLHPDQRGQGYATQINGKLCRMAISLGWKTISGTCDPNNLASQKVLARCGFTRQGDYWTKNL